MSARARVVRVDDYDDYSNRCTVTWRVYDEDGALLGNAYSEDEGHRWIEDMRKMREAAQGVDRG